jgi:hypothetical protein
MKSRFTEPKIIKILSEKDQEKYVCLFVGHMESAIHALLLKKMKEIESELSAYKKMYEGLVISKYMAVSLRLITDHCRCHAEV